MKKALLTFLAAGLLAACSESDNQPSSLDNYLVGEMASLTIPEAPQMLSEHIIMSENGEPKKLSAMAGKVMLVNLWAPWCAPCRAEMKELAHLQEQLGDDTFEVVAINVNRGGIPEARETLAEWGVDGLPLYAEPTMKIAFDLADGALPTSFVVDKTGQVRALFLGPLAWDKPESVALFTALKEGAI